MSFTDQSYVNNRAADSHLATSHWKLFFKDQRPLRLPWQTALRTVPALIGSRETLGLSLAV